MAKAMKFTSGPLMTLLFAMCATGCTGAIGDIGGDVEGPGTGQARGGSGGRGEGAVGAPEPSDCRVSWPAKRLSELRYAQAINVIFDDQVAASSAFPVTDVSIAVTSFSSDALAGAPTLQATDRIFEAAADVAERVASKLPSLLPCASKPTTACAEAFIEKFATRALRRTLSERDSAALMKLFGDGGGVSNFGESLGVVTAALLQMPDFIYTFVIPDATTDEVAQEQLAARIAFTLTDAPADSTLLAAAKAGALRTADDLLAQVHRLLRSPASRPAVSRFMREWLGVHKVPKADRKAAEYSDALAEAMIASFDEDVHQTFLDPRGTLMDLLTSTRTHATAPLLALYGVKPQDTAPSSNGFVEARPQVGLRSGLLTHPAVMTSLAHEALTSYVERGLFIRRALLCEEFPPPPADAMAKVPLFAPTATAREKSLAIRSVSTCASCHNLIDPPGLAFERFDEIGRLRDGTGRPELIFDGELTQTAAEVEGTFKDIPELGKRMGASQAVANCMAKQAFAFVYGRSPSEADACALDRIQREFAVDSPLSTLFTSMVNGPEFTHTPRKE